MWRTVLHYQARYFQQSSLSHYQARADFIGVDIAGDLAVETVITPSEFPENVAKSGAYELVIGDNGIKIVAFDQAGLFYPCCICLLHVFVVSVHCNRRDVINTRCNIFVLHKLKLWRKCRVHPASVQ